MMPEERSELRVKCWDLRIMGLTYERIGRKVGISNAQARRYCMEQMEVLEHDKREELRTIELERLDRLQEAAHRVLEGSSGHPDVLLKAIDRSLRISESRRRFLGLDDAPDDDTPSRSAAELELDRLLREAAERIRAEEERIKGGNW